MPLIFYPHPDELETSTLNEKLEALMDCAQRYKAAILDSKEPAAPVNGNEQKKMTPREIKHSFNWEEIAKVLQEIRHLPEANPNNKAIKAESLTKLAEIYEVLRGAKMAKLEGVRMALINEANQLKQNGT